MPTERRSNCRFDRRRPGRRSPRSAGLADLRRGDPSVQGGNVAFDWKCDIHRVAVAAAFTLACGAWLAVAVLTHTGRREARRPGFEHRAVQAHTDATGANRSRLVAAPATPPGAFDGLLPGIRREVMPERGALVVFGARQLMSVLDNGDYSQIAAMEGLFNQDFPASGGSPAVGGCSVGPVGALSGSRMCSSSTAGSGEGQRVSRGSLAGAAAHRRRGRGLMPRPAWGADLCACEVCSSVCPLLHGRLLSCCPRWAE